MTQLGEGVAIGLAPAGDKPCVFCQESHQDKKKAPAHNFPRAMSKLKSEGRQVTLATDRKAFYPGIAMSPLVEWSSNIQLTGGYKAAAHHCIALKTASDHRLSGEIHEAGYDPNRGGNCIWLPYSLPQFIRARAYGRGMQKHRGGHTDQYFETVAKHLDLLAQQVENKFCAQDKKCSKEEFLALITQRETDIWVGVAMVPSNSYKLYNQSYLDFRAPWGSFDDENGHSTGEILGATPHDEGAEQESAEDPE